ncbi:MAG: hypothetical protein A3B13_02650 [Candidatus Liptonbacteria bacterium RIFCSPLOWO2_01_FULL_45_15]|uniref:Uncharacterized protein n=1 Tax=Candidatus Liptonbacteria bacterium RIFCSPLOWO2_01_FULL_45_15 TaxID=1798649 RepID=A0A1G2CKM8_9BACT|nr:MAG: hypothetical protein A3B13_02650 [Candidatus Liptonbacteria bacterium RIFCSPLOWO2_01_FULL_45_15]
MKNNFLQEIFVSLILIVLLVLFLNPFGFWMPNILLMMMVLGLVVVFSVFASFIWRENARDEREGLHKMMAGRFAFLVGMAILVTGIIVQSFKHELDFWLAFTLGAMILAKIIGLIYGRMKH